MKFARPLLVRAAVAVALVYPAVARAASLTGFDPARTAQHLQLEAQFDSQLNPDDLRAWMREMASAPNHVGAPHDKANAEYTLKLFREWGWDARIETFWVYYPTPKSVALEMVSPTHFVAKLHEPAVAGDATSANTATAFPPYNAYGADGDVTGELVYANQGMPADYEELDRHGVSVKGRIVIARYGGGWRGLKPKLAYEHGAIGCIIYSDPKDDGYGSGDVYPRGGTRPADGVQRGSVLDMPIYPGDPLTPGVGATQDAKRLKPEEAKTILKIPVLPISYGDAQPLLAALDGAVVPPSWRGALPITYKFGPGPAQVHLTIKSDWGLQPLYNVIAMLPGRELPDEWVLRGNHRDGWVFGAWDPLSGHVAMMAEAKAMGALVKQGWRPRRTIVYCSWDGEETGLLGSTEWAEQHADELQKKAVLYLNSDTNTRGFFDAAGSHAFQTLVNEAAAAVRDPQTGVSVLERMRAHTLVDVAKSGGSEDDKYAAKQINATGQHPIGALGSGSDFTPYLQHLTLSALNFGFGGEDEQAGVYHSIYDTSEHYERFGDPGFRYGIALAQVAGRTVMRTADADVLPTKFTSTAELVTRYSGEVHALLDSLRESTAKHNKLVDLNAFAIDADPTEKFVPPARKDDVPFLNFAPLDNAVTRLQRSAAAADAALADAPARVATMESSRRLELEGLLQGMEGALASKEGLPGREWFKHLLYAPGMLTGYGVKTLPGIREALEGRRWSEAEQFVPITAGALDAYSDRLDKITKLLKSDAPKN
jgi:N-acetylated-alpha-linked acidic dipeptidase